MAARIVPIARVVDVAGLASAAVAVQRARYGRNDVVERPPHPWWGLAADTARDPMLWFLVVTSGLYALLGDRLEAATLALAIVPLTLMDVYLHRRTAASTAGLRTLVAAQARVWRDDREVVLAASELVPGDVVTLAAGALVPADGVLVAGAEVQVDESALTGESFPARKRPVAVWPPAAHADAPVDGSHWLQAGTRVLAGDGRLALVYTGAETLYGEIVRVAASAASVRTPLQRAIGELVLVLTGSPPRRVSSWGRCGSRKGTGGPMRC